MLDPGQRDTNIFFLWSLTYCLLLSMLCSWPGDKITVAVSKITSDSIRGGEGGADILWLVHLTDNEPFSYRRCVPWGGACLWASDSHWPLLWDQSSHTASWERVSKFLALWLETEKCNKITVHSHDVLGCLLLPLVWRAQKTRTQKTGFVVVWVSRAIPARISSVQSLSRIQLFVTPWTEACQASLSVTNSWSLLKLMSTELLMPSKHLILCHPLLLPPSIFSSIRVFSNESILRIRWPKYWSFGFSISPSS